MGLVDHWRHSEPHWPADALLTVMKRLLDNPDEIVPTMLEGVRVQSSSQPLRLLDDMPGVKVAVRADWDKKKVALVSGGGAGHEPFAAGYIGKGGITAAVVGEVFASPSTKAVLEAILATAGEAGVLILVLNYTGDRLHFGLAAEKARAMGIQCELVVIADDIAIPEENLGIIGARGIAGMVLVQKIVGAAAEQGAELAYLKQLAQETSQAVASIGVGFAPCTRFGKSRKGGLNEGEAEIGMGIHGEPGARKEAIRSMDIVVRSLVDSIVHARGMKRGDRAVFLVNNLGALIGIEMAIISATIDRYCSELGIVVDRLYCEPFMTSLDMKGFSISALASDDMLITYLDAPTSAPAWPKSPYFVADNTRIPIAVQMHKKRKADSDPRWHVKGRELSRVLPSVYEAVKREEPRITSLDTQIGDGDCGHTLLKACKCLTEANVVTGDLLLFLDDISDCIENTMGGTSGAIYSIFFRSFITSLQAKTDNSAVSIVASALDAASSISKYGGAKQGDRTLLDALFPALTALHASLEKGSSLPLAFQDAAVAATEGAAHTATMAANAGRSAYVPAATLASCQDPGAVSVAVVFTALESIWK